MFEGQLSTNLEENKNEDSEIKPSSDHESENTTNLANIEKYSELVDQAASLPFVLHGNSSQNDVGNIIENGLIATEGRATVSGNLIHAVSWATDSRKRLEYSKSETETALGENGGILVFKMPGELQSGLGTFTGIQIDGKEHRIQGDSLKYIAGLKQLGIYKSGNAKEIQSNLEVEKKKLGKLKQRLSEVDENNLDLRSSIQGQIDQQEKIANPEIKINKENILACINPSEELSTFLKDFEVKVKAFRMINLHEVVNQLGNILDIDIDNNILEKLIISTIESIVISRIRNFLIHVKKFQGYKIFNKNTEVTENLKGNKENTISEIKRLQEEIPNYSNISPDLSWLSDYVKENINLLNDQIE